MQRDDIETKLIDWSTRVNSEGIKPRIVCKACALASRFSRHDILESTLKLPATTRTARHSRNSGGRFRESCRSLTGRAEVT
jgi:hypothetical protein